MDLDGSRQGVSRIRQILSVEDVMDSIIREADEIKEKWSKEV